MAAAFLGLVLGTLVGLGVVALPTVRVIDAASSAADTLTAIADNLLQRVDFLQQNAAYLTGARGIVAVAAPGIVAALVALAARTVGALRAIVALVLSVVGVWALVTLSPSQSLPVVAIAVLVFLSALMPAIFAVQAALWAVVGLLGVTHAVALWNGTDETVNATVQAFMDVSRIASPELWRVLLSVLALVPFVGALSQATKSK